VNAPAPGPGDALLGVLGALGEVVAKRVVDGLAEQLAERTTEPPPEVLDRQQAAHFLGLSVATLDRLIREEKLPFHRAGEHKRFIRAELIEWLRGR
jgi:excisionase family DNA binding protein